MIDINEYIKKNTINKETKHNKNRKVNGVEVEVTEQELMLLFTRFLKVCEKIDDSKFKTALTSITGIDEISSNENTDKVEYTWNYQYVDEASIKKGEPDGTKFTFESAYSNTFGDDVLKKDIEVKILPKGEELTTAQLEEYGIKVADPSKTTLYLSENDISKVKKITVKDFKEWVELLISFLPGDDIRKKFAGGLNNDIYTELLTSDDVNSSSKSIAELKKEVADKTSEIQKRQKELNGYTDKIIAKKKKFLTDNKFDKLDKVSDTEDNRKTEQEIKDLIDTYRLETGESDDGGKPNPQILGFILSGKKTIWDINSHYFHDRTDIKLPTLNKDLDDTVITDNFKTKWEAIGTATKKPFEKRTDLETYLKGLMDKPNTQEAKIKDDFENVLKATDSKTAGTKINNLKVLMAEEPKKLKDDENDAKSKVQFKRQLAVAKGKKTSDTVKELTDTELLEALYELKEGTLSVDTTKKYNADLTEITTDGVEGEEEVVETETNDKETDEYKEELEKHEAEHEKDSEKAWEDPQEKYVCPKLEQHWQDYNQLERNVELCIELLQPKGELFDPCCGLGSFLLKAKSKDETLRISGNDIAKDLGELPFEFTNSDYLNKKIIKNTRKKALIILPSGVNSGLNKKITEKRIEIINSGVLELVCQLPGTFEKIKGCDYLLLVGIYDSKDDEPKKTPEEIKQEIKSDLLFAKYKDSQIKIKDHFKLVRGKTPPTKNPEYYENGTLFWLDGGSLNGVYFLTDEAKPSKFITEKAKVECRLPVLEPNSIIFSNVNTYPNKICLVKTSKPTFFSNHI
nr:11304_t:CDS:10 [Entrophospora candida]